MTAVCVRGRSRRIRREKRMKPSRNDNDVIQSATQPLEFWKHDATIDILITDITATYHEY